MGIISKNTEEVKTKKFKSLYEVLSTYIPNKDISFLEGQEDEMVNDTLLKIIEKESNESHKDKEDEK